MRQASLLLLALAARTIALDTSIQVADGHQIAVGRVDKEVSEPARLLKNISSLTDKLKTNKAVGVKSAKDMQGVTLSRKKTEGKQPPMKKTMSKTASKKTPKKKTTDNWSLQRILKNHQCGKLCCQLVVKGEKLTVCKKIVDLYSSEQSSQLMLYPVSDSRSWSLQMRLEKGTVCEGSEVGSQQCKSFKNCNPSSLLLRKLQISGWAHLFRVGSSFEDLIVSAAQKCSSKKQCQVMKPKGARETFAELKQRTGCNMVDMQLYRCPINIPLSKISELRTTAGAGSANSTFVGVRNAGLYAELAKQLCTLEFGVPHNEKKHGKRLGTSHIHNPPALSKVCKDVKRFLVPFVAKIYKKRQFRSICAWYKHRGWCRRKNIQQGCSRTCTHSRTDSPSLSRRHVGVVFEKKTVKSLCQFWKEQGRCKHGVYKKVCSKTCTATGADMGKYSKALTISVPVVAKKKYRSKCAMWESKGLCASDAGVGRVCAKTCGTYNCAGRGVRPRVDGPPVSGWGYIGCFQSVPLNLHRNQICRTTDHANRLIWDPNDPVHGEKTPVQCKKNKPSRQGTRCASYDVICAYWCFGPNSECTQYNEKSAQIYKKACLESCKHKGYSIAGFVESRACYCAHNKNQFDKLGEAPENECRMPCGTSIGTRRMIIPGQYAAFQKGKSQVCGGLGTFRAYQIDGKWSNTPNAERLNYEVGRKLHKRCATRAGSYVPCCTIRLEGKEAKRWCVVRILAAKGVSAQCWITVCGKETELKSSLESTAITTQAQTVDKRILKDGWWLGVALTKTGVCQTTEDLFSQKCVSFKRCRPTSLSIGSKVEKISVSTNKSGEVVKLAVGGIALTQASTKLVMQKLAQICSIEATA